MSDVEFNEFLSKLFDAIQERLTLDFDVVTVRTKKIKIMMFHGEEWGEAEVNLLKEATIKAANDFKDDFFKFGYEPIPNVEFRGAQACAVVKWLAKEN